MQDFITHPLSLSIFVFGFLVGMVAVGIPVRRRTNEILSEIDAAIDHHAVEVMALARQLRQLKLDERRNVRAHNLEAAPPSIIDVTDDPPATSQARSDATAEGLRHRRSSG